MTDYVTLLRDHVTLKCRSLDRIFLQAYVPKQQSVGDVCKFLRWQRKFKIPSSAAFGKIGNQYVKAVHRFAEQHKIPVVQFKKGEDKEKLARPYLEAAARTGQDCVVLIDIAQEKASCWRSWPRKGQQKGRRHLIRTWIGADRRLTSITSIFISGMRNGVEPSGRPTPMPPFPFGFGSTGMNGPSGS